MLCKICVYITVIHLDMTCKIVTPLLNYDMIAWQLLLDWLEINRLPNRIQVRIDIYKNEKKHQVRQGLLCNFITKPHPLHNNEMG